VASARSFRDWTPLAIVAVLGLSFSAWGWYHTRRADGRHLARDFEVRAASLAAMLLSDRVGGSLREARQAATALGSGAMSTSTGLAPEDFADRARAVSARHAEGLRLAWVARVPIFEAKALETEAATRGRQPWRLHSEPGAPKPRRGGRQAEALPILEVLPPGPAADELLGLDLGSHPLAGAALAEAVGSGQMALIGFSPLIEGRRERLEYFAIAPVWGSASHAHEAEEPAGAPCGYVAAVGHFERTGDSRLWAAVRTSGLDFCLIPLSRPADGEGNGTAEAEQAARIQARLAAQVNGGHPIWGRELTVAGQPSLLFVAARPDLVAFHRTFTPWGALLTGLTITGLGVAYFGTSIRGVRRVNRLAEELAGANTALEAEMREREGAQRTLQVIVEGTAGATGDQFFRSLARQVAEALCVRFVMIAECVESSPGRVRTLALWGGEGFLEDQEFALAGTPCEAVVAGGEDRFYASGVRERFPEDEEAARLGVESYHGLPLRDASGRVIGHIAVSHVEPRELDAAESSILRVLAARAGAELERLRTERRLRDSEERYALAIQGSSDALWDWDIDKQAIYIAPQLLQMLGRAEPGASAGPCTIPTAEFFGWIHPKDARVVLRTVVDHFKRRAEYDIEYRLRRADGTWGWFRARGRALWNERGRAVRMCGSLRDVSRRRQTEEALRESERRYRELTDALPETVFELDAVGRLSFVNPAGAVAFGFTPADLERGLDGIEVLVPEDRERARSNLRRILHGESTGGTEYVALRKDGSTFPVLIHASPLVQGNRIVGIRGVVTDLTRLKTAEEEKRALEQQLRHTQKMEAIGTLAGGVAHDFNNLLTGILGYSNLLKLASTPGERVYEAASVIEKAAEQAAELTRQLLGFARRGKLQNTLLDLNAVVQEVVAFLSRTLGKSVALRQHLRGSPVLVTGDPAQIHQVMLNLALNARDAMPQGGELTFETDVVELQRPPGALIDAPPGRYAQLNVIDTGCGVPPEHRSRIFEPFFTTKAPGKGTGMGLAMVYGIVKNHGGTLAVDSQAGRGATFHVYLPLAAEEAEAPVRLLAADGLIAGSGGILVVDDEEIVRGLAAEMLARLGYDVLQAADGAEAVDVYAAQKDRIDLVIVDMVMPRMGGRECFRRLRALNPDVRAILSSGYGRDGAAQEILDDGMVGFVQKPYRIAELSAAVTAALRQAIPARLRRGGAVESGGRPGPEAVGWGAGASASRSSRLGGGP